MIILKPTTILLQYLLYIISLVLKVSVQPLSVYSQLALDANMVPVVFPAVYISDDGNNCYWCIFKCIVCTGQSPYWTTIQSYLSVLELYSRPSGSKIALVRCHRLFGTPGNMASRTIFPRKIGTPPGNVEPLPSQEMLHPGHKIS